MQINTSSLFVNLNGRSPVLQNGFLKLIDKKMHSFYGGNEEITKANTLLYKYRKANPIKIFEKDQKSKPVENVSDIPHESSLQGIRGSPNVSGPPPANALRCHRVCKIKQMQVFQARQRFQVFDIQFIMYIRLPILVQDPAAAVCGKDISCPDFIYLVQTRPGIRFRKSLIP